MPRPKKAEKDQSAYEEFKSRQAEISRERSADGREIGPLPPVADPERKLRGLTDPEFFHLTYFPSRFYLGFGPPHLAAIKALADCTTEGGQFAVAMMRGGGKTTITECEVMRAILYGLRRYLVFIGATDPLAGRALKRIWREFETNDLLAADFPEVCHPIRALERINQRSKGQTLDGLPTMMEVSDGHIVLPRVPGSPASGAVIQSFGLTGAIKGLNMLAPDGTPVRPDMVVIDDAQTRESAKSPTQTEDREQIILSDVMGLAGPKTKMAAVFLCTPIYPNDLTERFINRERHPEWQGVRTRLVERMPDNLALWDEYSEVRRESLRAGDKGERGNEFYAANREKMDAGCVLSWPDRVKDGDISAVQTAMNLYYANPTGFASEYQCEPEAAKLGAGAKEIDPRQVEGRVNGHERYAVPPGCTRVTAFVDIGGSVHWYAVCAWNEYFGGAVLDYGSWPRQSRTVFAANDVRPSLKDLFPTHKEEQRVYAGIEGLIPEVLGRTYYGPGKSEYKVERCMIDAGKWPDAVYRFVQKSPFGASIYPSKGVARSDTSVGVAKWKQRPGERSGYHWRLTTGTGSGRGRQVQFDPDAWKTFLHGTLLVPPGGNHGLFLWGKSASTHAMIAEHCGAEASEPKKIRSGDTFDKWLQRPHRPDNHLWDCLVGCAVAASVQGLTTQADGTPAEPKTQKQRVKLSEELARKRAARG